MSEPPVGQISRTVSLMRGLYARVGRQVGCDVSYVSRIARGERRSANIEAMLRQEFAKTLRKVKLTLHRHQPRHPASNGRRA